MRVLVAQLNPKVADIDGNLRGMLRVMAEARPRASSSSCFRRWLSAATRRRTAS
jgi:hypothetical protein